MTIVNRQIILAARPVGFPRLSDFTLRFAPVASPAAGQVLVRSSFLSLDPYMRGRMDGAGGCGPQVALDGIMIGEAVGHVVESGDPTLRRGDTVTGMVGWQEYALLASRDLRRLDPHPTSLSTALGVLGTPGLAAYFGVLDICEPHAGETFVVSGASGAVGMVAGQIARIQGCRVVGVAAADADASWLIDELGFDAVVNYGTPGDFDGALEESCPDGVDAYFDNVGGALTDGVVRRINPGARIALCGQSSQHNLEAPEPGPRWLSRLIARRAKVQGFVVSSYAERFAGAIERLASWLRQGELRYREDVAQGLESAPQAFIAMLRGGSRGKQLVQLRET